MVDGTCIVLVVDLLESMGVAVVNQERSSQGSFWLVAVVAETDKKQH